jgi:predicted nucleic acid-binding protein
VSKTKNIQVTLEEDQYEKLSRIARREGKKLAGVVRESIEKYCLTPEVERTKREALRELLSLEPTPPPYRYEEWKYEYGELKTKAKKGSVEAYFLDANILMYAAGGPHPLRDYCRAALEIAVDRRVRLITDTEVLLEILYRYFALKRPDAARAVYTSATRLCEEVLPVAESHTARALEIVSKQPQLTPRDAIHIATMEARGPRRLLSTDRDFDNVQGIQRVDPADFAG